MSEWGRFPSILLWGADVLIYDELRGEKRTYLTDFKYVTFIDDSMVLKSGHFDWAFEELDFSFFNLPQNYPSWGSKVKFAVCTLLSLP